MENTPPDGLDPFSDHLDGLLAGIAIAIQLPPSKHALAVDRYERVRKHMEREGSPLKDLIEHFYPQGSMAIDATISTRWTDEDYDLDVVAQLTLPRGIAPSSVLDLVEQALENYPAKIVRQTRCVTVQFADGMHIDVTPAIRHSVGPERQSDIFHAKEGTAASSHYTVPMNAYGFAAWYNERTPLERRFAEAYNIRLYDYYGVQYRAEADVDEVPDQVHFTVKNTATVALQLVKRFRNVQYADYKGRVPPSVMLSYYAGRAATPNTRLSDMVIRQARMIVSDIERHSAVGQRLLVTNPCYNKDVFTDRWPESLGQQDEFARYLRGLTSALEAIKAGRYDLEGAADLLRGLFGKGVVARAIEHANRVFGHAIQSGNRRYGKGGIFIPTTPSLVGAATDASSSGVTGRTHTFMGGVWK